MLQGSPFQCLTCKGPSMCWNPAVIPMQSRIRCTIFINIIDCVVSAVTEEVCSSTFKFCWKYKRSVPWNALFLPLNGPKIGLDWQGLTSPPTQYRLSGRQFYRSKDATNSIKVLKENSWPATNRTRLQTQQALPKWTKRGQNAFGGQAPPRPTVGAYSAPPHLLAGLREGGEWERVRGRKREDSPSIWSALTSMLQFPIFPQCFHIVGRDRKVVQSEKNLQL